MANLTPVNIDSQVELINSNALANQKKTDITNVTNKNTSGYTIDNITENIYDPIVWHDPIENEKFKNRFVHVLDFTKDETIANSDIKPTIGKTEGNTQSKAKEAPIFTIGNVQQLGSDTSSSYNNELDIQYLYIDYNGFLPKAEIVIKNYAGNVRDLDSNNNKINITIVAEENSPYRFLKLPFRIDKNKKPVQESDGENTIRFYCILDIPELMDNSVSESILFKTCKSCRVKGYDNEELTKKEKKLIENNVEENNSNYAEEEAIDDIIKYTIPTLISDNDAEKINKLLASCKEKIKEISNKDINIVVVNSEKKFTQEINKLIDTIGIPSCDEEVNEIYDKYEEALIGFIGLNQAFFNMNSVVNIFGNGFSNIVHEDMVKLYYKTDEEMMQDIANYEVAIPAAHLLILISNNINEILERNSEFSNTCLTIINDMYEVNNTYSEEEEKEFEMWYPETKTVKKKVWVSESSGSGGSGKSSKDKKDTSRKKGGDTIPSYIDEKYKKRYGQKQSNGKYIFTVDGASMWNNENLHGKDHNTNVSSQYSDEFYVENKEKKKQQQKNDQRDKEIYEKIDKYWTNGD